jgi:hypothetical protein
VIEFQQAALEELRQAQFYGSLRNKVNLQIVAQQNTPKGWARRLKSKGFREWEVYFIAQRSVKDGLEARNSRVVASGKFTLTLLRNYHYVLRG